MNESSGNPARPALMVRKTFRGASAVSWSGQLGQRDVPAESP
jgi:hypothetical protein